MHSLMAQHVADVESVRNQIKALYEKRKRVQIYHGSTHSTRPQSFKKDEMINMSTFNRVLEVNQKQRYALVEPNVPMDQLVDTVLPYGLVPPVVMEFPGITVGGGVQGGAGESSSFRWGLFHECFEEFELILGNGEVLRVSRTQNSDLFWGTICSYGSLGIMTLAKLKLIPAKRFVHLKYRRTNGFAETLQLIEEETKKRNSEYIDGIMFNETCGTVMTGYLSDTRNNLPVVTFAQERDEWFYIHAEKAMKQYKLWEEIVPIRDYFFRYNRGAFWMGKHAFHLLHIPFTRFTRFLLNRFLTTRAMYRTMHVTNIAQLYLIQDISLPKETTLQFLETIDREFAIYPLWLCPLKPGEDDKLSPACLSTDLVINVGVWGFLGSHVGTIALNRELERVIKDCGGRKVLYAHEYMPDKEFWKIYNHDWYKTLRRKYHAEDIFSDIHENTHVSTIPKPMLARGLLRLFFSSLKFPEERQKPIK